MAQKISPAALRLYTNKKFDASWFSDRMYGSLLQKTLNINKFVHSILKVLEQKQHFLMFKQIHNIYIYKVFFVHQE